MWYSQSKVEKWGRRGLAPPLPPWGGGGGSGMDTIIVNWQKRNTSSSLEGEEIRQRAWGSPEEGPGPLCSSHESFPFGPKWRRGRRQRHSWGARLPTPWLLVLCAPGQRSAAKGGGSMVCQSGSGPPARGGSGRPVGVTSWSPGPSPSSSLRAPLRAVSAPYRVSGSQAR